MRTTLLLGALAIAAAAPARAEDPPRWMLFAEGGGSRIHDDDHGGVGALGLQRDLGSRGLFRIQLAAAAASYGAIDLGVEAHLWARARVSPFLGAGAGLMSEEDYGDSYYRARAGVEVKLSGNAVVRLAVQAGTHDGQAGPHSATVGFGWRF